MSTVQMKNGEKVKKIIWNKSFGIKVEFEVHGEKSELNFIEIN